MDTDVLTQIQTHVICVHAHGLCITHMGPTRIGWLQAHLCPDMCAQSIFHKMTLLNQELSSTLSPISYSCLMSWLALLLHG